MLLNCIAFLGKIDNCYIIEKVNSFEEKLHFMFYCMNSRS
uniref:Uncharacterized protein n=1 Tax=Nelumbo nucifera TaxID=4432 RepID=A0A822YSB3_NELNU|nr:TPA_asm: hypothetical protein HUJ06_005091 [Nelumbo nucifera]